MLQAIREDGGGTSVECNYKAYLRKWKSGLSCNAGITTGKQSKIFSARYSISTFMGHLFTYCTYLRLPLPSAKPPKSGIRALHGPRIAQANFHVADRTVRYLRVHALWHSAFSVQPPGSKRPPSRATGALRAADTAIGRALGPETPRALISTIPNRSNNSNTSCITKATGSSYNSIVTNCF